MSTSGKTGKCKEITLKQRKDTWQRNATQDPGSDLGSEKKYYIAIKNITEVTDEI